MFNGVRLKVHVTQVYIYFEEILLRDSVQCRYVVNRGSRLNGSLAVYQRRVNVAMRERANRRNRLPQHGKTRRTCVAHAVPDALDAYGADKVRQR